MIEITDELEKALEECAEKAIQLREELCELAVHLGEAVVTAVKPIIELFNQLESYQKYELAHPRKKPRGSLRRIRRHRRGGNK